MPLSWLHIILSGIGGLLSLCGILWTSEYCRAKCFAFVWRHLKLAWYVDRRLRKLKENWLENAQIRGKVLDVGTGDGINLKYFIRHRINIHSILCIEPNSILNSEILRKARELNLPVELFAGTFEEFILQNPETEFDSITGIFVLCSVGNAGEVIEGMYSKLKRGGTLALFEHIKVTDCRLRYFFQIIFQPIHYYFGGSCNLLRLHAPTLKKYAFEHVKEEEITSYDLWFPWMTKFYSFIGKK